MHNGGAVAPAGDLGLRVIHDADPVPDGLGHVLSMREVVEHGFPQLGQDSQVRRWKRANLPHLLRGVRRVATARALRLPHFYGQLWLRVIRADGQHIPLGLASQRVVTDDGVEAIVDVFQAGFSLEDFKYHALGTGAGAEAAADSALATELTTEYTGNVRDTGTNAEGASANIYRTVGTNTVDEDPASDIIEHGVFDQAATGGGTLLDRTVFGGIDLDPGDGIQSTYELTFTAGS